MHMPLRGADSPVDSAPRGLLSLQASRHWESRPPGPAETELLAVQERTSFCPRPASGTLFRVPRAPIRDTSCHGKGSVAWAWSWGGDLLRVPQGKGPQDTVRCALENAPREAGRTDLPALSSLPILRSGERTYSSSPTESRFFLEVASCGLLVEGTHGAWPYLSFSRSLGAEIQQSKGWCSGEQSRYPYRNGLAKGKYRFGDGGPRDGPSLCSHQAPASLGDRPEHGALRAPRGS